MSIRTIRSAFEEASPGLSFLRLDCKAEESILEPYSESLDRGNGIGSYKWLISTRNTISVTGQRERKTDFEDF
jgi:hypothetical protein